MFPRYYASAEDEWGLADGVEGDSGINGACTATLPLSDVKLGADVAQGVGAFQAEVGLNATQGEARDGEATPETKQRHHRPPP